MLKIGNKVFNTHSNTFIMGILNITPDSFFDGGLFNSKLKALKQVETLIKYGADLIDIGAESTKPGYVQISDSEELKRIDNLIFEIKQRFDTPISIDTTKPKVAEFALQQGADLINDISCLKDENIAKTVAKFNASYCLMHNKKIVNKNNFLNELIDELKFKIQIAQNFGISENKILVDPGIGFNKTSEESWLALINVPKIAKLGFPVLIGASNKSFIGKIIDEPNPKFRTNGTIATTTIATILGASFIRVHDVKSNIQALKIAKFAKDLQQTTLGA